MTGWDTGVDESFSLFYKEVFSTFGVPADVCEAFVETRHTRRSFMGPMGAMQASGDRFTWLCNTLGNMAVTSLTFKLNPTQASCFSGDDMLLNGHYARSVPSGAVLHFVPKVEYGKRLEFCGYQFGGPRLVLSPRVLLHRATMALEDGRRDVDFWRSVKQAAMFTFDSAFTSTPEHSALVTLVDWAERKFDLDLPVPGFPRLGSSPGYPVF
jgi:hypothetical protein